MAHAYGNNVAGRFEEPLCLFSRSIMNRTLLFCLDWRDVLVSPRHRDPSDNFVLDSEKKKEVALFSYLSKQLFSRNKLFETDENFCAVKLLQREANLRPTDGRNSSLLEWVTRCVGGGRLLIHFFVCFATLSAAMSSKSAARWAKKHGSQR